jgi:hypothetical protein
MGQEGKGEIVNLPIKNVEVSRKTISEIDVDSIGKKPLIKIIEFLNELVFSIISPEDPKKLEIKKLLKSGEDPKKVAKKYKLNPEELKIISEAQQLNHEIWFAISQWAKKNSFFTPFDRKLVYNIGIVRSRGKDLSIKQARQCIRIYKEAVSKGFIF